MEREDGKLGDLVVDRKTHRWRGVLIQFPSSQLPWQPMYHHDIFRWILGATILLLMASPSEQAGCSSPHLATPSGNYSDGDSVTFSCTTQTSQPLLGTATCRDGTWEPTFECFEVQTDVVTEFVSIVSDQTSQPPKDLVLGTTRDIEPERGTTFSSKTESESSLETELNAAFQTYTVTEVHSQTPPSTSPTTIVTMVTDIDRSSHFQEVLSNEMDSQQITTDETLGIRDITLATDVTTEFMSIVSDQTSQPTKDSVHGAIGDINAERGTTILSNTKSESSLETDWDSEFQVTTMSFSVDNARINTEKATTEKQDELKTRTDMTLATEIFTAVSTRIPLSSRSDNLSFVDNNVTNEESDEKMAVSSELTTEPIPQWSSSTPLGSIQEAKDIVTEIARQTQIQEVVSTEIDIQQRTADDTLGIQDITLSTDVDTEFVSNISNQTSQPTKYSPVDVTLGDNIGERWTTIPSKTEREVSLETEFNAGFQTYTVTEVHSQTPSSTSLTNILTDIARSSHIQEVLSNEMDSQQITTDETFGIRDITLPTDVVTEFVNIVSDQTSQPTKDSVHGTIGDDIAESGTTRPSKTESESSLVYVWYTKIQEYTVTDVHSRTPPSTSPTTIVADIARSSHIQEVLSTEVDSQQITTHEKLGIQDITLPTDVDTEFVSIVSDQTSQPTKDSFHGAIGDINAERGTTIPSNTKSESSLETDWDSEIQATTMSSSEDNARINTERSTTEKQDELRTRTDTTLGTEIFAAVSTQIPLSSTLDDLSNVDDNVTNEESDEKMAVSSELTTEPRPQWSSSTPLGSMQETTDIVTEIASPTQIQEVVSPEIDIQQRTPEDTLGIQDIVLPTDVDTEFVSILSDQTSQPTKDSVLASIGDDLAERGTTIPSKTESESILETELNTEFQTYTVTEVQSPTPSSTSPKIIFTDIARPSHIQYLLSTDLDSQRITTHETLGVRDITLPTDVVTEFVSIVLDQTSQPTKDSVHGTIRDNIRERGTTIQSKTESELSLGTDWDTEYQTYTVTEVLSPTPSSTSPPTKIMSTAIDGDLRSTDQPQDLIFSYLGTEQATEMLISEDNVRDKAQQVTTVQQTTLRSGRRTTLATEHFTGVSTHILMTSRTDDSSLVDIKMTDVDFDEKTAFISELTTEVRPQWSSSTPIGSMRRTTDIVTEIKRPTHIQEFMSSEMDPQQITTDKPLGIKDVTLPSDVAIEFVSIVLDQTSQPTKDSQVDGTIGDNIADRGTTTQTKTDSEISLGTEWDIEFETYTVTDVQSSKPSSTSPKTIVTDIARPTHIQELVSTEMDSQQITTDEALGIQDITDSISAAIDGDPKSTDQSSDMKSSFLGTETPLPMPTTEGKPGTKTEGVLTEIPDTPTLEGDGDLTTEIITGISTQIIMTSKSDDLNLWDATTPLLSKSSTNTGTDLPTFSFEAIVTEKSDIVSDSLEITETEKGISQEMDFESAATDKPFQMTDATYSTLSVTHDLASILERTLGHTKKQHSEHTFPMSVTEDEWYTETITYSLEGKESSRDMGQTLAPTETGTTAVATDKQFLLTAHDDSTALDRKDSVTFSLETEQTTLTGKFVSEAAAETTESMATEDVTLIDSMNTITSDVSEFSALVDDATSVRVVTDEVRTPTYKEYDDVEVTYQQKSTFGITEHHPETTDISQKETGTIVISELVSSILSEAPSISTNAGTVSERMFKATRPTNDVTTISENDSRTDILLTEMGDTEPISYASTNFIDSTVTIEFETAIVTLEDFDMLQKRTSTTSMDRQSDRVTPKMDGITFQKVTAKDPLIASSETIETTSEFETTFKPELGRTDLMTTIVYPESPSTLSTIRKDTQETVSAAQATDDLTSDLGSSYSTMLKTRPPTSGEDLHSTAEFEEGKTTSMFSEAEIVIKTEPNDPTQRSSTDPVTPKSPTILSPSVSDEFISVTLDINTGHIIDDLDEELTSESWHVADSISSSAPIENPYPPLRTTEERAVDGKTTSILSETEIVTKTAPIATTQGTASDSFTSQSQTIFSPSVSDELVSDTLDIVEHIIDDLDEEITTESWHGTGITSATHADNSSSTLQTEEKADGTTSVLFEAETVVTKTEPIAPTQGSTSDSVTSQSQTIFSPSVSNELIFVTPTIDTAKGDITDDLGDDITIEIWHDTEFTTATPTENTHPLTEGRAIPSSSDVSDVITRIVKEETTEGVTTVVPSTEDIITASSSNTTPTNVMAPFTTTPTRAEISSSQETPVVHTSEVRTYIPSDDEEKTGTSTTEDRTYPNTLSTEGITAAPITQEIHTVSEATVRPHRSTTAEASTYASTTVISTPSPKFQATSRLVSTSPAFGFYTTKSSSSTTEAGFKTTMTTPSRLPSTRDTSFAQTDLKSDSPTITRKSWCGVKCQGPNEVCIHSDEGYSCRCIDGHERVNDVCSEVYTFKADVKIVLIKGREAIFTPELTSSSSTYFKELETEFCKAMELTYKTNIEKTSSFYHCDVINFRPGSIIVEYMVRFTSPSVNEAMLMNETLVYLDKNNGTFPREISLESSLVEYGPANECLLNLSDCDPAAKCIDRGSAKFTCRCSSGYDDLYEELLPGRYCSATHLPPYMLATWVKVVIILGTIVIIILIVLLALCTMGRRMRGRRSEEYTAGHSEAGSTTLLGYGYRKTNDVEGISYISRHSTLEKREASLVEVHHEEEMTESPRSQTDSEVIRTGIRPYECEEVLVSKEMDRELQARMDNIGRFLKYSAPLNDSLGARIDYSLMYIPEAPTIPLNQRRRSAEQPTEEFLDSLPQTYL